MAEIPLGIKDDVVYPQSDLHMEPGDIILTYTDGVNEAINPDGDLYSNRRAEELLSNAPDDALHVGQALVADVRSFSGGLRQSDDICLLCFGRLR
jgi:sigma-B regulation protein RsbU (phosphoserine phosphatase)